MQARRVEPVRSIPETSDWTVCVEFLRDGVNDGLTDEADRLAGALAGILREPVSFRSTVGYRVNVHVRATGPSEAVAEALALIGRARLQEGLDPRSVVRVELVVNGLADAGRGSAAG